MICEQLTLWDLVCISFLLGFTTLMVVGGFAGLLWAERRFGRKGGQ